MSVSMFQHTVSKPSVLSGVGIHSGRTVRLSINPAPAGHGIVFVRTDVLDRDNRVPVRPEAVCNTLLNTEIANASGVKVSTIEHLMAALAALSIDNVRVELDGPETPIMDGSALDFIAALDRAGRREQGRPRCYLEMLDRVEVRDGDKLAALSPADQFSVDFEIAFAASAVGRQRVTLEVDEASFRRELAGARTFGFLEEVERLRAAGLALGGSLDNVVVVEGDRVLNPGGLRFPNEFARHKALDAIGDLYVLGAPVIGALEARYAGHALNNALNQALLARPEAWRMRSFTEKLAAVG